MDKKVFEKMLSFYTERAEEIIKRKIYEIDDKNEDTISFEEIRELRKVFVDAGNEIDLLFNKAEHIAGLEETVQRHKQKLEDSLSCWK